MHFLPYYSPINSTRQGQAPDPKKAPSVQIPKPTLIFVAPPPPRGPLQCVSLVNDQHHGIPAERPCHQKLFFSMLNIGLLFQKLHKKSQHGCGRWALREHLTPPSYDFACCGLENRHHTNETTNNLLGQDSFVMHYFIFLSYKYINSICICHATSFYSRPILVNVVHVDTPDQYRKRKLLKNIVTGKEFGSQILLPDYFFIKAHEISRCIYGSIVLASLVTLVTPFSN